MNLTARKIDFTLVKWSNRRKNIQNAFSMDMKASYPSNLLSPPSHSFLLSLSLSLFSFTCFPSLWTFLTFLSQIEKLHSYRFFFAFSDFCRMFPCLFFAFLVCFPFSDAVYSYFLVKYTIFFLFSFPGFHTINKPDEYVIEII